MAKLSELKIENAIVDTPERGLDDLPEQIGSFADPPQPGTYRVQFPSVQALSEAWDVFDSEKLGGQRIASILRGSAALTIIQSPGGKYDGEAIETRINNAERKRGKDETKLASDMDYALMATKFPGKLPKFGDNKGYAEAFYHVAGKQMDIDWEYTYFCNDDKPARIADGDNGMILCDGKEGHPDQKGCGKRYYQKDFDRQPNPEKNNQMEQPVRVQCECGAEIRAFGQIARFRETR